MASRARKKALRRELALLALGVALAGFGVTAWNGSAILVQEASMLGTASVSISASVPQNPDNTLAVALQEKQAVLDAREAQLREEPLRAASEQGVPWGLLSFAMSMALFVLVAANFYFDMQRGRPVARSPFAIDLRNR